MDYSDVVINRHSIRHFRSDPVPRGVVERLIEYAVEAPSSMDEQPWEFYCCRGAARSRIGRIVSQATVHLSEYMEILGPERYDEAVEWYSSLGGAPVVVAVSCLTPDNEFTALNRYLSIGGAVENFLLGATAEGLGSCNITFTHWVRDELAAALGVPDGRTVVTLIALGYPAEVPGVRSDRRADVAVWLD